MSALSDVIGQAWPRLQAILQERAQTLNVGGGELVTLGFMADDSSRHRLCHLAQVWERAQR